MVCQSVRRHLQPGVFERLSGEDREQVVEHISRCQSCRQAAAAIDPSLIFCLLPRTEVDREEIEEVRHTVQAMRRIRALEASWTSYGRRALAAAGSVAALLLLAVLMFPDSEPRDRLEPVPFAGALGVGAGLVEVPDEASSNSAIRLRLELEGTAVTESSGTERTPFFDGTVSGAMGTTVDRPLGEGHRVRFEIAPDSSPGSIALAGFRLTSFEDGSETVVFSADLKPEPGRPLLLGLPVADDGATKLWLRLTWQPVKPTG